MSTAAGPGAEAAGDPRIYFAGERTLLAWIRTGTGVMAFGFVVARFGLVLRLLRAQAGDVATHPLSPLLGAALVLIGALATAAGAIQYRRFTARLATAELPSPRAAIAPLALAWSLVAVGLVLVLVLLR